MNDKLKAKKIEQDLIDDVGIYIYLGTKRKKVKRLKNWAAAKITRLILEGELMLSDDKKTTLTSFNENRLLVPKCLSLAILGSWWKIKLFYWIYWRYLNIKYTQEDFNQAIKDVLNFSDISFFFHNMAFLQSLVEAEKEMTSQSTKSIIQKQESERKMT